MLARLTALHPKLIDLKLDRVLRLLERLGNPERRLPPVIHVAGTNGKGSTVAFMRAMLEAAGRRVHAYTSPHLVRFNERIVVAGEMLPDGELLALLEECERANEGRPITFFEITTAAAFLAFSRAPADVLLLEVGLGGRLDTTNVVERPAVTAITPVARDHTQFLGETLAEIAGEKAGIVKPGVPLVLAPQEEEAKAVILAKAAEAGAPVHDDWRVEEGVFHGRRLSLPLPKLGLAGAHQSGNAGLALACLEGSTCRRRRFFAASKPRTGRPGSSGSRRRPKSGSTAATTRRRGRCWPSGWRGGRSVSTSSSACWTPRTATASSPRSRRMSSGP